VMHSTSEYDYRIFATHDEASGFAGDCAVEEGDDDPEIIALYPLSPPDDLAAAAKLLTDMAEAFRTGHTIYPTSDYATSVSEIADRLAAALSPPDTRAAAEIEATWRLIESEFDIEPRAQIEAEAKTNGFKYGLAQAIHTIWKRDPKVAGLAAAAEEAVAKLRSSAVTLDSINRISDAEESISVADRLAAELEKRGRV